MSRIASFSLCTELTPILSEGGNGDTTCAQYLKKVNIINKTNNNQQCNWKNALNNDY